MHIKETDTQENIYPRQNVYIRMAYIDNDFIPIELKNAQIEAAKAAIDQDLLINTTTQNVASEKLDVLEVSYFSAGSYQDIRLDRVDNHLKPLLNHYILLILLILSMIV